MNSAQSQNIEFLRSRLKLKSLQSENLLKEAHPQAIALLESKGVRPGGLREHARKLLAGGAVATALMFSPPQSFPLQASLTGASDTALISSFDMNQYLKSHLKELLPLPPEPLTPAQEEKIQAIIHDVYGIHASAELEGNRLNRSYGLIGAEQHLPRYPGDNIYNHDALQEAGITPGRGAWGYFTQSSTDLTPEMVREEKYYVAVQTLYLPDWSARLSYLRDWYRYRKVILINPQNGKAVIADIADSGPASWTGKNFGGSPEVMNYLQMKDGRQKGPVVLFFVDDPDNQVPLGPLEYNLEKGPPLLSSL